MSQDRTEQLHFANQSHQETAPLALRATTQTVVVPDSAGLLTAEFSRRGPDLVIGSADTPALVILDYFVADTAPDLITSGGAILPGRIVSTLAGPGSSGTDTTEQQPIGHVEQLEGEVVIIRADGTRVVASEGTPLFQDDVITTDGEGAVGLRFVDGMTLSLGSDARMVLDEFAYDAEAGEGGGLIEVIQGAFSFVSGKAAHVGLDSLVIDTPTMTIGIRGTKVIAQAAAEGETTNGGPAPRGRRHARQDHG